MIVVVGMVMVVLPCPCVSWVVAVVPRASGRGSNQAAMLSCTRVDGVGRDTAHGDAIFLKKRRSSGPQALSMSCRHVYESGMRARELYHGHAHHAAMCLATCM